MDELLFQLYKLPYPTAHIVIGLGLLVCVLLILLSFLSFFPVFKDKKKELFYVSLSVPFITFGVIIFTLNQTQNLADLTIFGGADMISTFFLYLFQIVFQLGLLIALRSRLNRTYYPLLLIAMLLPVWAVGLFGYAVTYQVFTNARPFLGSLDSYLDIFLIRIPFYCLFIYVLLSPIYTFVALPLILIYIVKIPDFLFKNVSKTKQAPFQLYIIFLIFFSFLAITTIMANGLPFLKKWHQAQPCASSKQIDIFKGHARELCEYRTNKNECPQTEHDLASFKLDLYKNIQLCNNTRYYFDTNTNTYTWEINSVFGSIKYTFDLNKTGYPHGAK